MNKADVVDAMAKYTKLSKAQSKEALEAFLDVIAENLKKGKEVVLTGFGSFSVLYRGKPSNWQKNANSFKKGA